MIEIPEVNKKAAEEYRALLREMRRRGIKVTDLPEDVAQSMLRLHQNALSVFWAEHLNKKRALDIPEGTEVFEQA